jgi:hypothetical protein
VGFALLQGNAPLLEEQPLGAPLFAGPPSREAKQALVEALAGFAGKIGRRYLPLHVSVPDALVRWAVFELDEMPRSPAARLELARFRFARQGANGASVYACQALERDAHKHLLLGMAMDGAWRGCVAEALAEAGLRAWTLSANACRVFNRFHDRLAGQSGALVAAAPDAWSLWLWDERGRLRHARSRWRAAAAPPSDIALETERSIFAYVEGTAGRSVARVFVAAGTETPVIADALDARLRQPCTRLPVEDSAAPLAAALER